MLIISHREKFTLKSRTLGTRCPFRTGKAVTKYSLVAHRSRALSEADLTESQALLLGMECGSAPLGKFVSWVLPF